MSGNKGMAGFEELRGQDEQVLSALRDFRASVHGWSDAEFSRPRTLSVAHRRAWRRSAAWAMSLVLAAGAVGGGVFEHHQKQVAAVRQMQMERELEQRRQIEAERAKQSEDLLAKIDSDISRQVPSAMEPLAQLMEDSQ